MLGPSTAIWLRKMIVPHMPGGRAPLESGLGAKPSDAGVTIAILGIIFIYMYSTVDFWIMYKYLQIHAMRATFHIVFSVRI